MIESWRAFKQRVRGSAINYKNFTVEYRLITTEISDFLHHKDTTLTNTTQQKCVQSF